MGKSHDFRTRSSSGLRFLVIMACWTVVCFQGDGPSVGGIGRDTLFAAEDVGAPSSLNLPVPSSEQQRDEYRARVVTARFSAAGRFLALGMESGRLAVIDLSEKCLALATPAHQQPIKLLAFARDDRYLVTGADDLDVHFWDLAAGEKRVSFQGAPLRCLYDIAISPDASYAAGRGFDGFGVLWDLTNNQQVTDLFSYMFAFAPNGKYLVSAARRQPGMQLIGNASGSDPIQLAENQMVASLAIDPTGHTLAYATSSFDQPPGIVLAQLPSGRLQSQWALPSSGGENEVGVTALSFSRDGQRLLAGCTNGRVLCYHVPRKELEKTHRFLGSLFVTNVEFSGADGQLILATGQGDELDTETRCWKLGATEPMWTKPGNVTVAVTQGVAARVTTDGDVELFSLPPGQPLQTLRAYVHGTRWLVK